MTWGGGASWDIVVTLLLSRARRGTRWRGNNVLRERGVALFSRARMEITPDVINLVRKFMSEQIPFNAFLGVSVDVLEPGRAVLSIPFRREFIGDPFRPALHGGVISALIDTCGGAAVWTTVKPTDRVSTIDLRVDYLRPGRMEPLVTEAQVIRSGNRVGVASIRAFHPSASGEIIAEGKGVYNIRRAPSEDR